MTCLSRCHPISNDHLPVYRFVNAREALAMVELGADHITVGIPVLTDLAHHQQLPAHKKGMYKTSIQDQIGQSPDFIWEDWKPPSPSSLHAKMEELSKSDPTDKYMTQDWKMMGNGDVDYLQTDVLDQCNEEDEVTKAALKEALTLFSKSEDQSREYIQRLQGALS